MTRSIPAEHFDSLYRAHLDPWNFAQSAYEQRKYRDTLHHLGGRHYRSILEVGCSIGVLSGMLGARCDAFLGIDCSSLAVERAASCHAGRDHMRFEVMIVPDEFPAGRFQLIVLSEVLYFLDGRDLARLAGAVREALSPTGELVLVNFLGATDTVLGGDAAAERFIELIAGSAVPLKAIRRPEYRIDVLLPPAGGGFPASGSAGAARS